MSRAETPEIVGFGFNFQGTRVKVFAPGLHGIGRDPPQWSVHWPMQDVSGAHVKLFDDMQEAFDFAGERARVDVVAYRAHMAEWKLPVPVYIGMTVKAPRRPRTARKNK